MCSGGTAASAGEGTDRIGLPDSLLYNLLIGSVYLSIYSAETWWATQFLEPGFLHLTLRQMLVNKCSELK